MTTSPPHALPGDDYHFAVVCPVDNSMLNILRRFITSVAAELGFDEDDIMKIEISVDEACSNITRHAYQPQDRAHGKLELKLRLDPEALTILVRDHGRGSETGKLRGAASIEDYRRPGRPRYDGLGMLIIHKFMDTVAIESRPGQGTTLTMRKVRK